MKLYFSDVLGDLICESKKSQSTIAKEIGISKSLLSSYVSGNKKNLTTENLCKIADYFGVTTDYLLGRSQYKSANLERFSAGGMGLSQRAAIAMYGDASIVPALNLLVETENFEVFLKTLYRYYHACEADCVVEEIEQTYSLINAGNAPDDKLISEKLEEMALSDCFDLQTQSNLFTLSERFAKKQESTIFTSDDEDNVFLNQLQMRDLYEVQTSKYLHKLIEKLEKMAVLHIRRVFPLLDE